MPCSSLDLRHFLCPLLRPEPAGASVAAWLAGPLPLRVDASALPALPPAEAYVQVGSASPVSYVYSRAGSCFSYDATYRERQGGRRYAYAVPGYAGPLVLGHTAYAQLALPRVLLPAIPRALRGALRPPDGHVLVDVDIDRCFLAIAAAVSRDGALQADLRGHDLHAAVGAAVAPQHPDQRKIGKLLNNAMVGGMTAVGVQEELNAIGVSCNRARAQAYRAAWWVRYPTYSAWVTHFERYLAGLAAQNIGLQITNPAGHTFAFSPAEVRGWRHRKHDLHGAHRSIISSLWRAVEGAVLDRALELLHVHREHLHVVLPMYDGVLLATREEHVGWARDYARYAFEAALYEARVDAGVKVRTGPTWGDLQ